MRVDDIAVFPAGAGMSRLCSFAWQPGRCIPCDYYGAPDAIRLDNGPEMVSEAFTEWVAATGIVVRYIQLDKSNQNAYIETLQPNLPRERTEVLGAHLLATSNTTKPSPTSGWAFAANTASMKRWVVSRPVQYMPRLILSSDRRFYLSLARSAGHAIEKQRDSRPGAPVSARTPRRLIRPAVSRPAQLSPLPGSRGSAPESARQGRRGSVPRRRCSARRSPPVA